MKHSRLWLSALLVVLVAVIGWVAGPTFWSLVRDEAALEAFVAQLGPWGPLALIGINAAQIVVAPLPGYVMQVVAGYLYGPLWGGVWGSLGLLAGAMLAMLLARTFGRPVAERLIGAERLAQWETVTFSTGTLVWFLILLAPTGDLPYFMAGLARVSFLKILLLTLAIRVPSTMVVAAAGAGVWLLSGWQLGLLIASLGIVVFIFIRYQERLLTIVDRRVQRELPREELP